MGGNKSLLGEFWDYFKIRKTWWVVFVVIMLLLIGALIIISQSSVLSPFIYSLW